MSSTTFPTVGCTALSETTCSSSQHFVVVDMFPSLAVDIVPSGSCALLACRMDYIGNKKSRCVLRVEDIVRCWRLAVWHVSTAALYLVLGLTVIALQY